MKKNVGTVDKTIRLVLACVLIGIAVFADIGSIFKGVAVVFAAIAILTSLFGSCPLYSLVGIDTTKRIK
jgi:hypothetical protein